MQNILVLFHAGCSDGFASATVACYYYSQVAVNVNNKVNLVFKGLDPSRLLDVVKEVIENYTSDWIVFAFDLSFTLEPYLLLYNKYKNLTIIDHHISTKDLCIDKLTPEQLKNSKITFNNDYCGSVLTYMHYFPNQRIPCLLQYIQVRDLWLFNKPGDLYKSKTITDAIFFELNIEYKEEYNIGTYLTITKYCYDLKVPSFNEWIYCLLDDQSILDMDKTGETINKVNSKLVKLAAKSANVIKINEHYVYAVQSNLVISELGNYLLEFKDDDNNYVCDYVLIWRYDHVYKKCFVSLRSRKNGTNVSQIASQYGGGGHAAASGFETNMQDLLKILNFK